MSIYIRPILLGNYQYLPTEYTVAALCMMQVMEVLQLKCGVSVNKMVLNNTDTDQQWVEVRPPFPIQWHSFSTFPDPKCKMCAVFKLGCSTVHQQNRFYYK
jgi:hypothetical protein